MKYIGAGVVGTNENTLQEKDSSSKLDSRTLILKKIVIRFISGQEKREFIIFVCSFANVFFFTQKPSSARWCGTLFKTVRVPVWCTESAVVYSSVVGRVVDYYRYWRIPLDTRQLFSAAGQKGGAENSG